MTVVPTGTFAPDSGLMRFLTRIADLAILNVVFIVTALPIVTLGAALTALNFTAMRLVRDESVSTTGDYFRSFKSNFRQATVLGLGLLALAAVLAAWFVVVSNLAVDGVVQLVLLVLWYIVAFAFAINLVFVFPYLAHFEGTVREVLRTSRQLSWRHPLTALMVIALMVLAVVVTIFYPQVTAYGLLWLAIGFSGIAFLSGVLFVRVFDIYAPRPASSEE